MKKLERAIKKNTSPLAYLWYKLRKGALNADADPWKGIAPIFIISTGRTATKFFAKFFEDRFRNVKAVHEPPIDIFPIAVSYFRGDISFDKARFLFKHYRKDLIKELHRENLGKYIESNPRLAFMIPVIRSLSDDYRIVHIVRDCKSYVRSGFSKETTLDGKKVKVRSNEDKRARITAKDFPNDPYHLKWDQMTRFERNCWFWQKKDRLIQEELENDPLAKRFFYEDLFESEDPEKTWENLIGFLGLHGQERKNENKPLHDYLQENIENRNANYELGDWEEWPSSYKEKLIEIAGDHMTELGYKL